MVTAGLWGLVFVAKTTFTGQVRTKVKGMLRKSSSTTTLANGEATKKEQERTAREFKKGIMLKDNRAIWRFVNNFNLKQMVENEKLYLKMQAEAAERDIDLPVFREIEGNAQELVDEQRGYEQQGSEQEGQNEGSEPDQPKL